MDRIEKSYYLQTIPWKLILRVDNNHPEGWTLKTLERSLHKSTYTPAQIKRSIELYADDGKIQTIQPDFYEMLHFNKGNTYRIRSSFK